MAVLVSAWRLSDISWNFTAGRWRRPAPAAITAPPSPCACPSARTHREARGKPLLLLDVVQFDRPSRNVLHSDVASVVACGHLCRKNDRALPAALVIHVHLDDGKRVID